MKNISDMINLVTFHRYNFIRCSNSILFFYQFFFPHLAYGAGQLTVLESPDTILFKKTDKLDGKFIGHVLSACTGHSITDSVPLKLQFTSPFDLAENVCLINIDGVKEFSPQNIKPKSEISVFGTENSNEAFVNQLYEEDSSIVHIHLDDGLEAVSK